MRNAYVRIAVVRLCECEGNDRNLISAHGRLTERGRSQALATRRRLMPLGMRAWICPENSACLETAAILSGGGPIRTMQEFREQGTGEWAGQSIPEIQKRREKEWSRVFRPGPGDILEPVIPGGESYQAVAKRVWQGLDKLLAEFKGWGTVAIVTHGEVVRLIAIQLLGAPIENLFRIGGRNGAVTIFDWDGDGVRFECINETYHLSVSESRDLAAEAVAGL